MLASAHSTLGHFVEFASKWPGLLAAFNGTVNRVMLLLYYRRRGYAEALDPMCELLRLAFFSAKVDLPRVYSHKALETLSGKTVCFERMIVNNVKSAQHIEHFESREAATNYRYAILSPRLRSTTSADHRHGLVCVTQRQCMENVWTGPASSQAEPPGSGPSSLLAKTAAIEGDTRA